MPKGGNSPGAQLKTPRPPPHPPKKGRTSQAPHPTPQRTHRSSKEKKEKRTQHRPRRTTRRRVVRDKTEAQTSPPVDRRVAQEVLCLKCCTPFSACTQTTWSPKPPPVTAAVTVRSPADVIGLRATSERHLLSQQTQVTSEKYNTDVTRAPSPPPSSLPARGGGGGGGAH